MTIDVARVMKRQSKYQPYESTLERDPAFEWKEPAPQVEPKNKWRPVLLALPFIIPFGVFSVLGIYKDLYPVQPESTQESKEWVAIGPGRKIPHGPILPAKCDEGDMFVKSGGEYPPYYLCAPANTWSGHQGAGMITNPAGKTNSEYFGTTIGGEGITFGTSGVAYGMATFQMGDQSNAHAGYNANIVIGDAVEAIQNEHWIVDPGGHFSHEHVIDLNWNYGHKRSHKKH